MEVLQLILSPEQVIAIVSDADIVEARMAARALAEFVGFTEGDLVMIATAVSEVARNHAFTSTEFDVFVSSTTYIQANNTIQAVVPNPQRY